MALSTTKPMTSPRNGKDIRHTNEFKRFDVVSDHSDHFYSNVKKDSGGGGGTSALFTIGGSKIHKKIVQEWKILENHLPDSIYVRVYETRIDLLRAVIVGAAGTPYHDALFFFDMAFPLDYPRSPPKVHYRSCGYPLNPNLYANGYVCISLLNTWPGVRREKWDPTQSTILQVLVSIQALVLNENPYFNEPGHGMFGRARCEKASRAYNETVFILTCKTTLFMLRIPPKNFEAFTRDHFRRRASKIMKACDAYANGRVAVGYYEDGVDASVVSVAKVGKKFKDSMEQLYPELFAAFRAKGANLGNLLERLKVVEEVSTKKKKSSSNTAPFWHQGNNNNLVKRTIAKLKKVLGLGSKKSGSGAKRSAGVAAAEA